MKIKKKAKQRKPGEIILTGWMDDVRQLDSRICGATVYAEKRHAIHMLGSCDDRLVHVEIRVKETH
jgi:hypothetical protein